MVRIKFAAVLLIYSQTAFRALDPKSETIFGKKVQSSHHKGDRI